jgi:hypothetical protein
MVIGRLHCLQLSLHTFIPPLLFTPIVTHFVSFHLISLPHTPIYRYAAISPPTSASVFAGSHNPSCCWTFYDCEMELKDTQWFTCVGTVKPESICCHTCLYKRSHIAILSFILFFPTFNIHLYSDSRISPTPPLL